MSDTGTKAGPTSLGEYAAIVWRRKLTVLAAVVGVPIIAVAASSLQSPQYKASADVLLRNQSIIATVTGVPDVTGSQDPQRLADTQAKLARVPDIAIAAIKDAKAHLSVSQFLDMSSVSADSSADILTFSVRAGTPDLATRLDNAYAAAYTSYRAALDRGPVQAALATVNARLVKLRSAGAKGSALYSSLVAKQQQLQSILAVPYQSAKVVDPAESAPKTRPRPVFDGFLGLIAGILLGVGAALGREAIDKRPRSTEELRQQLGLRTLGRIPSTPEGGGGLVALSHPGSVDAEVFRLLRLNFEHAAEETGGRVFAVTSTIEGEGKSTVASNLAVALARAGRSVVLVDCDPLRPVLRDRFRLAPGAGIVEVASGRRSLQDALVTFPLPSIAEGDGRVRYDEGAQVVPVARRLGEVRDLAQASWRPADVGDDGTLRILTSNPTSVEFGDHLVATRLEALLDQLRHEGEVVILDSAPLTTSVGTGVGRLADGLIVVVNLALMRRPMVDQLSEILDELATPKLGLVLNGVPLDTTFTYGYYAAGAQKAPSQIAEAAPPPPANVEGRRWSSAT